MFKFNFGDDANSSNAESTLSQTSPANPGVATCPEAKPKSWLPEEIVKPGKISWTRSGARNLPRRDLFDVRYELMAQPVLAGEESILLGDHDVLKDVYEGGLKVWDGGVDLEAYVAVNRPAPKRAVELGAGAGLPSWILLFDALKCGRPLRLVVADYNVAVLRLVTIPNAILCWITFMGLLEPENDSGELDINPELIARFTSDLQSRQIELVFVSGGWGSEFSALVGTDQDLVLAAETIYSVASTNIFTDVLNTILSNDSLGVVAAKRVYFGVGGSLTHFEEVLDSYQLQHRVVNTAGDVGRVIIEITHLSKDHLCTSQK